jgi:hypothetical protein
LRSSSYGALAEAALSQLACVTTAATAIMTHGQQHLCMHKDTGERQLWLLQRAGLRWGLADLPLRSAGSTVGMLRLGCTGHRTQHLRHTTGDSSSRGSHLVICPPSSPGSRVCTSPPGSQLQGGSAQHCCWTCVVLRRSRLRAAVLTPLPCMLLLRRSLMTLQAGRWWQTSRAA